MIALVSRLQLTILKYQLRPRDQLKFPVLFFSSFLALQIFSRAAWRRLHNLSPGGIDQVLATQVILHQVQLSLGAGLRQVLGRRRRGRTGLHPALQSRGLADIVISVCSQGGEGLVDEVKVRTGDVIVVL